MKFPLQVFKPSNSFTPSSRPAAHEFAQYLDMPEYENLSDHPLHLAGGAADELLAKGWGHGGRYPLIRLDAELPWFQDSPEKRSWNFHLHSWDMSSDLLLAHSVTGRPEYLKAAIGIALDWIETHPHREHESYSQFAWYDMAVGLRAHRLAYIIDAARRSGLANKTTLGRMWRSLLQHDQYLADDANIIFHNNHGFYQAAGQLAMGRRFSGEWPSMQAASIQAETRLKEMLAKQFTREGVHKEHSPDYHRMVYGSLKGMIASGLVKSADTLALMEDIERSLAWFVIPNGALVNFGDTDVRTIRRSTRESERKWLLPEMRYMASGGQVGAPPSTDSMGFMEAGYYITRRGWAEPEAEQAQSSAYLALAAAFHSRTHKHADDLSIVWHDRGHEILVDAGRYGYLGKAEPGSELFEDGYWYSDPNRVYCEATRAHNTVEIDGRNFMRKGVRPYGSGLVRWGCTGHGIRYCEAQARQFRTIRHFRTLLYLPSQWLIVFDWLHDGAGQEHEFRQWWHFDPSLSVRRDEGIGFRVHAPDGGELLEVQSLLKGAAASEVHRGVSEPEMQGFCSRRPQQMLENDAVAFKSTSTPSATFATLFSFAGSVVPDLEASRTNVSGRRALFVWREGERTHRVSLARPIDEAFEVAYQSS